MLHNESKPNTFRYVVYALFFYATLIVDFYRKFSANVTTLPLATETFRNMVYVLLFGLMLLTVTKKDRYFEMIAVSIGFGVVLLFSWMLNYDRGASWAYINVVFMFFSRLLPAFFIGKFIVGNEHEVFRAMSGLRWLALAYIALIMMYPETSEESYITISGNLLIPSLVLLLGTANGAWKIVDMALGVLGCGIMLVYGGRGSLVSVALVFLCVLLVRMKNPRQKYAIVTLIAVIAILMMVFYDDIVAELLRAFPKSRTIRLLESGDFMWSSNRDSYYTAAINSLLNEPFKMYGFLGDRFYFADTIMPGTSLSMALSMFAHNAFLEILLHFGLFLGLAIVIFLVIKFVGGFVTLSRRDDFVAWKWHLIMFGSSIVTLMMSSSYLNDYMAWVIAGSFFALTAYRSQPKEEETPCP